MNSQTGQIRVNEHRIINNAVTIQVREYAGAGDTVIFLHFSGANLMMWQPALPHFQGRYRVLLPDLRGHGKSSLPDAGYHMDDMAEDIIEVLHHLGIQKAHVVGSSLGAEVGLSMAANHPNKILSLTCEGALYSEYGPYGIWQGTEQQFNAHVAARLEKIRNTPESLYPSIDELMADRRKVYEGSGMWNECIEAMVRYGVREVKDGKYCKSWGKNASEDYTRNYFSCRFENYYRRIQCPILMLPDEDMMNGGPEKEAMIGLQQIAAHCEVTAIPGWSHPYGWLLTPELACPTVLNFLAKATS